MWEGPSKHEAENAQVNYLPPLSRLRLLYFASILSEERPLTVSGHHEKDFLLDEKK
jgi:hypothetical protein